MGNALVKAAVLDCAMMSIELVGWAMSYKLQTGTFFDVVAESTFVVVVLKSMIDNGTYFPRQVIQSSMVSIWAVRLGLFLLFRTLKSGGDVRYQKL